jgi:hypothetical protein
VVGQEAMVRSRLDRLGVDPELLDLGVGGIGDLASAWTISVEIK